MAIYGIILTTFWQKLVKLSIFQVNGLISGTRDSREKLLIIEVDMCKVQIFAMFTKIIFEICPSSFTL